MLFSRARAFTGLDKSSFMHNDIELTAGNASSSEIIFADNSAKELARLDIKEGLAKWRIWLLLAYQDIKLRYRRSVLGPFWIALSMGITVYSMGFLYARLFKVNINEYYPFLVAGMLTWALVSTVITELTDTYMSSEGLIKQIKLPYSLYIHRVIARNFLIFFHNLIVIVPIYIIFASSAQINLYTLLLIPGLALIYANSFFFGIILGIIGARYRDVSQIIKSLVQVIFFVTPVMWAPQALSERAQHLILWNPFYSYMEVIRAPLLGKAPSLLNYSIVLIITILLYLACFKLFVKYRARIIYWL